MLETNLLEVMQTELEKELFLDFIAGLQVDDKSTRTRVTLAAWKYRALNDVMGWLKAAAVAGVIDAGG